MYLIKSRAILALDISTIIFNGSSAMLVRVVGE